MENLYDEMDFRTLSVEELKQIKRVPLDRDAKLKLIPDEFLDVALIIRDGAIKHGADTWLDENNPSLLDKPNLKSIMGHVADGFSGLSADEDSGLDPYLHAACRCLMKYTRRKRGIE